MSNKKFDKLYRWCFKRQKEIGRGGEGGEGEGEGEEQRTGTLNSDNILESATETEQKASQIMQTYLGNEPDSSEAIEFLCLAEAGEVTHYEVLDAMMKKSKFIKNKQQLATQIRSILGQEKKHLQLCTKLAKQNAILQWIKILTAIAGISYDLKKG